MTIKECIKKKGLQYEVDSFKRFQSVDIGFINSDGENDETQFDIHGAGTKEGTDKLGKMFFSFCQENKVRYNNVISVTVVASANTMEELN